MNNLEKNTNTSTVSHKVLTIVGIVLCVILVPLLVINVTLIIRSYTKPDEVPSFGKVVPMVIMSDSMYPKIKKGDLIVCRKVKAEDVKEDDIISFFDPASTNNSVATHRVIEIVSGDEIAWRTKGDANNMADDELVPAENLVGVYSFRIAGAGRVALFMRKPQGLIICVVLPMALFVGYDMLRRRKYEKEQKKDTEALMQELEELRSKTTEQTTEENTEEK